MFLADFEIFRFNKTVRLYSRLLVIYSYIQLGTMHLVSYLPSHIQLAPVENITYYKGRC